LDRRPADVESRDHARYANCRLAGRHRAS
jgi:hypothetical protein